jgi:hypothetical protein
MARATHTADGTSAHLGPGRQSELVVLPAPSPDMVHAARARLAGHFATGVDALLWDTIGHPMHDSQAVASVLAAAPAPGAACSDGDRAPAAMDFGAAFIVLAALRLDVDRLEADLIDAATQAGLDWQFIARALGITVAQARERLRVLGQRRESPVDRVPPPALGDGC